MSNKKLVASALLASIVFCGSAFATSTSTSFQEALESNGTDIAVRGAVVDHDQGNIYILDDGMGHMLRADLGKHGGKLLGNNAFVASGRMTYDVNGPLLKVRHVDYQDPEPLHGPSFTRSDSNGSVVTGQEAQAERDPAFYHSAAESTNKYTYANGQTVGDPQDYKDVSAAEAAALGDGTKVALTGRAVSTYGQDQMNFWDMNGQNVVLVMNGTYIPLGQRCKVLGVVQNGKVSVLRIDSVA